MQSLGGMTFDHVITWQIKNISQLLQRLQSPNLVGTHMRTKCCHYYYVTRFIMCHLLYSFMSLIYVIYNL